MKQSEHGLQVAVARMLDLCLDPARTFFTGIDHAAKLSARYGADRRRRGIKRGLPDFLILVKDESPIGLEIKTDKGRLSDSQRELRDAWVRLGIRYRVARSLDEVQGILLQEHVPTIRKMFVGAR